MNVLTCLYPHQGPCFCSLVIGLLTWNYILNEIIRFSLIMHLLALLLVVLWIR